MVKHIKSEFGFDGIIPSPKRPKSKSNPLLLNTVEDKAMDWKTQKLASYSQFQMYSQCPHKWSQQYVHKKFKTPPSIHLVFGNAVHETIQEYLRTGFTISFAEADRLDLENKLQTKMSEQYTEMYNSNNKVHFSTPAELNEFYQDGVEILKWLKKKRKGYFTNRGYKLVGIEMPLHKEVSKNVIYKGYIDLVLYDENDDRIIIYDIKTSGKGWNDWDKKNASKTAQILLYKQYFSELYGFPIDRIDVKFFIVKRKAEPNDYVEFPKRVQEFVPANGKIKIKQAMDSFNAFISDCFDSEGKYNVKEYPKNITKLCEWCPLNNTSLCIKD